MPSDEEKKRELADLLARMTSAETPPEADAHGVGESAEPAPRPPAPRSSSSSRSRPPSLSSSPARPPAPVDGHDPSGIPAAWVSRPDAALGSDEHNSGMTASQPARSSRLPGRQSAKRPWMETTEFRRTLIPIFFTLAILCAFLGLMGFFVDESSPFHVLARPQSSVPLLCLSALFIGALVFTMLHVRHDLQRNSGNRKS